MTRPFAPLLALAVALAAPLLGCGGPGASRYASDEANHPALGKAPPPLTVRALPGQPSGAEPFDLTRHAGKVVVIDFWATWCEPCRIGLPKLDALVAEHPSDVVALAVSEDDDAGEPGPFVASLGLKMPVAYDDEKKAAALWALPPALPVRFVLDRKGVVRGVFVGGDSAGPDRAAALAKSLL